MQHFPTGLMVILHLANDLDFSNQGFGNQMPQSANSGTSYMSIMHFTIFFHLKTLTKNFIKAIN
jgi:hypothetical protein